MEKTKFQQALERALVGRSQAEVARESGVAASTISTWLSGGGANPEQVFAVERVLDGPGTLSKHLGYVPVGTGPAPVDVIEAIEADDDLPGPDKDALVFLYSFLKSRSAERESVSVVATKRATKSRKSMSR